MQISYTEFHSNWIITREAMYARGNIEARSHNHCRRGKAISITYYECVSVTLVIQHAKCMRHDIYGFSCSAIFFHIIS